MGWSSGGSMASAFLDYANKHNFATANGTNYVIQGLVLVMSGSQFCYAYDSRCPAGTNQQRVCSPELQNSSFWRACNASKKPYGTRFGCCPSGLTEDYFYRNPAEYPHHAATLLVQSRLDCNSDTYAAAYYHQEMRAHNGNSTHFVVGGMNHGMSPPVFGVMASWIRARARSS